MFDWLKRMAGRPRTATKASVSEPAPPVGSVAAPAPVEVPAYGEADLLEDVRRHVARSVASGFARPDEIVEDAVAVFEDEADEALLTATARKALADALAARMVEQATWPAVTDCDRLDAAFAALEAEGVIARHDFTCCGTCGSAEIWDEMRAVRDAGGPVTGYAFYHRQDTERAADGEGLYLAYGAVEEGDAAAVAVGRRIMAGLRAQGLAPECDGRIERRIALPLDWKRRAPPV
jgi:hypothetical protein